MELYLTLYEGVYGTKNLWSFEFKNLSVYVITNLWSYEIIN